MTFSPFPTFQDIPSSTTLKEIMLEKYHFLKQDYDALSRQLIEKDEVIQKLQDSKNELELEASRLQKFEMETVDVKVPSSLSFTLDDVECQKPDVAYHDSSHAFVTPSFENYTTSIGS